MTLGGGVTMSNSSCQASEQHSKSAHKRDVWRQHNNDDIYNVYCADSPTANTTQPTEQLSN